MSTIKANQWLSSDGTENFKCKAFVNFNGTGTVAIRASGNVSSITDNGTGDYTVNFTSAMVDANYSAVFSAGGTTGGIAFRFYDEATPRTSSLVRFFTTNISFNTLDIAQVNVVIFR